MKKLILIYLFVLFIGFNAIPAHASLIINDFCYEVIGNNTLKVTHFPYKFLENYEGDLKDENFYYGLMTIPSKVTYGNTVYTVIGIGDDAFSNCPITSISIPNTITSIGKRAFANCTQLKNLTIPNSVQSIGDEAIYGCTKLSAIELSSNLKSVGKSAFQACPSLQWVGIKDIVSWCNIDFANETSNPVFDQGYLYTQPGIATNVVIPDGVKYIGKYTFCASSYHNAFQSISIPNSVVEIKEGAFYQNSSITSNGLLSLPENLRIIGVKSFYKCTGLQTIKFSSQIEEIGMEAFKNCNKLTNVYVCRKTPPNAGTFAFIGISNPSYLYVPKGMRDNFINSSFGRCFNIVDEDASMVWQDVTSITLNATSVTLDKGKTKQLTATVSPSNASNKHLSWKSSNSSVAMVGNEGLVTAVAAGTATITCSATDGSGKSATCTVKVTETKVSSITLDVTSASLIDGQTKQLTATISPSNASDKTVTWSSNNSSVATVSSTGLVTAVSAGTATITCKANDGSGKSATCAITVNRSSKEGDDYWSETIDHTTRQKTQNIETGKSYTASFPLGEEKRYSVKVCKWSTKGSSNVYITAKSTDECTFRALKAGESYLYNFVKLSDGSTYETIWPLKITGDPIPVSLITLQPNFASLKKGETQQLTATVEPSYAADKTVTWSSNDSNIATVSSTGLVTAVAAGTATITCTAADGSGKKATCTVYVTSTDVKVTSITLNATSATLTKGSTKQLTATISPSNATNKTVTWTTSNTSVATVSSNGLVTAIAAGTATITCKATDGSGKNATCTITVTASDVKVTSVTLNASSATLTKGATKQLTATISPSNATNKTVTWTTSNTSVATVSSNGLVTAIAAGTATITCKATDGSGKSATCAITVQNSGSSSGDDYWSETADETITLETNYLKTNNEYNVLYPLNEDYLYMVTVCKWSTKGSSYINITEKSEYSCILKTLKAGKCNLYTFIKFNNGYSVEVIWPIEITDGSGTTTYDNISVMTSSAGYATFYSSETAYTLPSHLSAQVVTNCYDNKLTFTTIADGNSGGVIPKGTAVMLVNDMKSSASFTLVPSTSTTQYTGTNYLHGSDVATTTSASGTNYYYKLTYGDAGSEYSNIFGWYWGASNGAPFFIEGHKAWLALPTSAVKRSAFFVGDVSGINDLIIDEEEGDGLYYDILGRPVKEPNVSGVYIRNGKKVLIMK